MKVVVVGAGFAGLRLAQNLNNKPGFEVLLLDRFNYHQFQPLFYQVATASLDPSNISFPLRKSFHGSKNVRIRLAKVESIDTNLKNVKTDIGEIGYDVLVLATGADTNFFGSESLKKNTFPMKSTVEALQIRHRLIENFEEVLLARNTDDLEKLLNVVVVGGGPTGVELTGALAEMKKNMLPKDYPEIDFSRMKIYLLEGLPKTLATMSEKSSEQSKKYLEKLGVTVLLNTMVQDYDGEKVVLKNGKTILSSMVIWAAGVKGNVPKGIDEQLIARGNRIKVDRYNRVIGEQDVYALGDLAYMETPVYQKGHPQVASVAIQQAELLSQNLRRMESKSGKNQIYEFEYYDKGSMATVGRNLAVVDIPKPKLHFGGFPAWLVWMGLHLFLILGAKNKIFIFINWIYNYITHDQSLRLLFKEVNRPKNKLLKELKPKAPPADKAMLSEAWSK